MWKLCAITDNKRRYSFDPRENTNLRRSCETFGVLKEKEIKQSGEYRTQRFVLAAWDAQEAAVAWGELSFAEVESREVGSGSVSFSPQPTPPATVQEPAPKLELKRPSVPAAGRTKAGVSKPALNVQSALVTDFTPPQGSYAQRLKRVMALSQPQNQVELTELIAALGDENENIRWLAGSALSRLGGLPVVRLLAAYLQTNAGDAARTEVMRVLETIAAASEVE